MTHNIGRFDYAIWTLLNRAEYFELSATQQHALTENHTKAAEELREAAEILRQYQAAAPPAGVEQYDEIERMAIKKAHSLVDTDGKLFYSDVVKALKEMYEAGKSSVHGSAQIATSNPIKLEDWMVTKDGWDALKGHLYYNYDWRNADLIVKAIKEGPFIVIKKDDVPANIMLENKHKRLY